MDLFDYIESKEDEKAEAVAKEKAKPAPQAASKPAPKEEVPAPEPTPNHLTVSQLANQLRMLVEKNFFSVAVEGEISSLKLAASGHAYLRLKDNDSVINAVMWRGTVDKLRAMGMRLEDGLQVVARGKVSTFGARSEYQLVISSLELAGEGALMMRYEALKKQLTEEGLFAENLKKPLPYLPKRIGIITSPQGAVIHDMLHRLTARFPIPVVFEAVSVQGVGSKEAVVEAIGRMNALTGTERPDVLIVARGGGSLEDLWTFNEEDVVRAVAASDIPVISGVGHEPDVTLCDFAADKRAPTPTAAAEMVVPVKSDIAQGLARVLHQLTKDVKQQLDRKRQHVTLLKQRLPNPVSKLQQDKMRLDYAYEKLVERAKRQRENRQIVLGRYAGKLDPVRLTSLCNVKKQSLETVSPKVFYKALKGQLKTRTDRLEYMLKHMEALRPDAPLSRGFAYITGEDGTLIKSSSLAPEKIKIHFSDGVRSATVDAVEPTK
ncbi:MAG: exodeoxyribonuclease VII large subunit [Pseudomonadota bacterium]|nr:exodeoxyribonuclease VII large subunit [Pseudomonadota bacterium]